MGDTKLVEVFPNRNEASVNAADHIGDEPPHTAILGVHMRIVRLLLGCNDIN